MKAIASISSFRHTGHTSFNPRQLRYGCDNGYRRTSDFPVHPGNATSNAAAL